jgi:hypothetical protein
MKGYDYILARQIAWANRNDIPLIGSKGLRGRAAYTAKLDLNLFQPLLPEVMESIADGDGGELGTSGMPGKMQAVHSSSALGVNVFQYWKAISKVPDIAAACGFCRLGSTVSTDICFEDKFTIDKGFSHPPNIDVVIHNEESTGIQRFAIECKFSEAYGSHKHGGLKPKYLECPGLWDDVPHLRKFAETISPEDGEFKYLHPAQLVKHILGLKQGKNGLQRFRLLYLWYDVPGEEGKVHRDEVKKFESIVSNDEIKFHSMTYQELIAKLAADYNKEHSAYLDYITERYL